MAKKLDALLLTFLTYTLIFLWSRYFIGNLIWSLIFSAILSFLIVLSFRAFSTKVKKRPYSVERLAREFALKGNDYVAKVVALALGNPSIEVNKNMLTFGSTVILCSFRFSSLGASDIALAYQLAIEKKFDSVILLCRGADRQAMSIVSSLPLKIEIVKTAAVFHLLNRTNTLPALDKEKLHFSIKYIFDVALKRQNAKFFVFSGIMLLTLSYFTPLKLYYLCFGSSLLLLAVLCLSPLGHIGDESKHKLFDSFSNDKIADNQQSTMTLDDEKIYNDESLFEENPKRDRKHFDDAEKYLNKDSNNNNDNK